MWLHAESIRIWRSACNEAAYSDGLAGGLEVAVDVENSPKINRISDWHAQELLLRYQ